MRGESRIGGPGEGIDSCGRVILLPIYYDISSPQEYISDQVVYPSSGYV